MVSKDSAGAFREKVFLAKMNAVEACGEAEIGAVIHEEGSIWTEDAPQLSCMREHVPGTHILGAVLKESDARGSEFEGKIANGCG